MAEPSAKPFVKLKVPLLGVVGGIGSGKSLVARMLAEAGGTEAVDADLIGHAALRQPDLRAEVIRRVGEGPGGGIEGADGEIDRKKLGALVFADPNLLKKLQQITHPWIRRETVRALEREAEKPGARWVVLDASVLLESGWRPSLDRLIYVHAPDQKRRERILSRPGWTEEMWKSREKAQLPLTEKRRLSDDEITNSTDLDALGKQVSCTIQVLEALASNPA